MNTMIFTHVAGMLTGIKSALDIAACLPAALCNNPVGVTRRQPNSELDGRNLSDMNTNPFNGLLIRWIVITSFGWLIAQTIGISVTSTAFPKAEFGALPSSPLYFGVFGFFFGLSQWICLREHIPNAFRWVVATALGFFVAALTLKLLNRSEVINSFLRDFPLLAYFFGGMITGFAQHQVIKKTLRKAYWWTIVVAISWSISQVFIRIDNATVDFLGVLVFVTVTGLTFVWLVQNPFTEIQPAYRLTAMSRGTPDEDQKGK